MCVAAIAYLCFWAIMKPIYFNRAKAKRDAVVEQRLNLIRRAEIEYSKVHHGEYCGNWMELLHFIRSERYPKLIPGKKGGVKSDSMLISLADSIFPKHYPFDSLKYVPYGSGISFELTTKADSVKWKRKVYFIQIQTPFSVYLRGINAFQLKELVDIQAGLGKYCGLRIGDLEQPGVVTGNWEN